MREQGMFDPARLVFIDETAANAKMVRLCGRCPRGERLIDRDLSLDILSLNMILGRQALSAMAAKLKAV
jgi:hypothetical protein